MRPRHLIIYFFLPFVWKFFPKRKLAAIQEFSQTELDSAWQGLYAIDHIDQQDLQVALFYHALEEFYHADLFRDLYEKYNAGYLDLPVFAREAVLEGKGTKEVLDFLAYLHVGEREVNKDFAVYCVAPIEKSIRTLFQKIREDEAAHVSDSEGMIAKWKGMSPLQVRKAIFFASLDRMYRQYSALMSDIGKVPLRLIISLVYFAFGWMSLVSVVKRLRLGQAEQTQIAQEQKQMYDKGVQA